MPDKVVADLEEWVAEERQAVLERKVVVVEEMDFAFDSYTSVAYHDVQFDDGVCQDIGEQEQEDGSGIHI